MTTIRFDIPEDIAEKVRALTGNLSDEAREAFLVGLYRRGCITLLELGAAMALDRLESEALLKKHDVPLDLTLEAFRAEVDALRAGRK